MKECERARPWPFKRYQSHATMANVNMEWKATLGFTLSSNCLCYPSKTMSWSMTRRQLLGGLRLRLRGSLSELTPTSQTNQCVQPCVQSRTSLSDSILTDWTDVFPSRRTMWPDSDAIVHVLTPQRERVPFLIIFSFFFFWFSEISRAGLYLCANGNLCLSLHLLFNQLCSDKGHTDASKQIT